MAIKFGQGNFIDGSFINEGSITLVSKNPSSDYEPIFSTKTGISHVEKAVGSAKNAYKSWCCVSVHDRIQVLLRLKQAFIEHEEAMAQAISQEMGKIISEAKTESKSLSARIDLMIDHGLKRVATEPLYDLRAETRHHSQGVLVVLGPYNFPAHLVNAHVIPSVLLGNTVIIKPSEVCPMTAEIYAQCVQQAGIPAGVINVVHGDHTIAQALVEHPGIDGVLFTGSYKTGRLLQEKLLDQPHKILALEMGGKNCAVVMHDADIAQAAQEIILGAFLTAGQRCTATSRVLIHHSQFEKLRDILVAITKTLKPCKPHETGMFGPMATKGAVDKFFHGLSMGKHEGAEVLVESQLLPGGAFVTPSLYQVSHTHPVQQYLGEELFGPHITLEPFYEFDEAIARINQSPYGLSNAIFTLNPQAAEKMYYQTKSGVLNINRSTNNAFGQMPFGGVNKSGNQRPAGIDAVRYVTFPTALTSMPYGESQAPKSLTDMVHDALAIKSDVETLAFGHRIEACFELYGIYSDFAQGNYIGFNQNAFNHMGSQQEAFFAQLRLFKNAVRFDETFVVFELSHMAEADPSLSGLTKLLETHSSSLWFNAQKPLHINVPPKVQTPRSRAMLDRLYQGHFVPKDKKSLVADMQKSRGAYLASIDHDPLVIFDAASQIATLGAGFQADTFQNAYDDHQFDKALVTNIDLSCSPDESSPLYHDAIKAKDDLEQFLKKQSQGSFLNIAYASSGAEANEVAFDMCRRNGPGGTRIIAFEGAFHGRTIMALQATFNKEKRGPFAFLGFEATFVPFPEHKNPSVSFKAHKETLKILSQGEIPQIHNADELLKQELFCLAALREEVFKGNVCAVIIEPMQCEGGDRYATDRFFSYLRALTRGLKVPLIFDEVQTGFHLGKQFFWYQQLNLVDHEGNPEIPDCVTLAKKAQLGICMSVWPHERVYSPHVIQLKRALLHAQSIDRDTVLSLEEMARHELWRLTDYFPSLVSNPRACGLAFAFDMPSNALAMELIDQRFMRGFMAYIAGERTLRFRLNMAVNQEILHTLFEKLFLALVDIRDRQVVDKVILKKKSVEAPIVSHVDIKPLTKDNFKDYEDRIKPIEEDAYEPNRRDSMEYLLGWLKQKDSVGLIMTCRFADEDIVAGYAIGGPLEYAETDGTRQDPHRFHHNSFYAANLTFNKRVRGLGLGTRLKHEQINQVLAVKNHDGSPRYHYMTGRNRIGKTLAMNHIIEGLGAYVVGIYDNQYQEPGAKALYYRIALRRRTHNLDQSSTSSLIDCQNSLQVPFNTPPQSFIDAIKANEMRAVAGSKLTLSNWATPNMVRYSELLRAVMPAAMKHTYFTSGRDEMIDKGLRSLRYHRLQADVALGFSHQWLGHHTAAARSLSFSQNQPQPFSFFSWPLIPHPSVVGIKKSIEELQSVLGHYKPEKFLGIVVELVGERSGFTFSSDYLAELESIRNKTGIPLVFVENASSLGRSGRGAFLSDTLLIKPNMVLWYAGGQLGHVLVDDQYFVEKPLTLISTWDGDEISMMRAYHYLLKARDKNMYKNTLHFEERIKALTVKSAGFGSWHGVSMADKNAQMKGLQNAKEQGILFGQGFDNALMICPKPDCSSEQFDHVIKVLEGIL